MCHFFEDPMDLVDISVVDPMDFYGFVNAMDDNEGFFS